jgi:hypothetical protein
MTMYFFPRYLMLVAAAALLTGCAAEATIDDGHGDGEAVGGSSAALLAHNGLTYNGLTYNGLTYNGLTYNGLTYNGLTYNGIELQGTKLSGVRVDGTQVSGSGFVGSSIVGVLSDQTPVTMHVDAVSATSDPDIWLHTLSYADGSNVCGVNLIGQRIKAILLSGRWDYSIGTPQSGAHIDDPTMFTLACVGSTIAKCTQLGYKPWKTVEEHKGSESHLISRGALHQACVRMLRADYCGDGAAHTLDGRQVNVWDNFGIQKQSSGYGDDDDDDNINWQRDAEWTPEGAACIDEVRYNPGGATTAYINAHCPERWNGSCFSFTSTFYTWAGYTTPLPSRSLLRNEFATYGGGDDDDDD